MDCLVPRMANITGSLSFRTNLQYLQPNASQDLRGLFILRLPSRKHGLFIKIYVKVAVIIHDKRVCLCPKIAMLTFSNAPH